MRPLLATAVISAALTWLGGWAWWQGVLYGLALAVVGLLGAEAAR